MNAKSKEKNVVNSVLGLEILDTRGNYVSAAMPHIQSYNTVVNVIPFTPSSQPASKHRPPPPPPFLPHAPNPIPPNFIRTSSRRCCTRPLRASPENLAPPLISASGVVRSFYDGINRHDLASVEPLIAMNCFYEDLVFPTPFVGRKAILDFFQKFIDSISTDLQFVVDGISEEDSTAVGVTWHLEWKGKPFPFSKGCSFYRLEVVNGERQIMYARDCVEPAIKPGESVLTIMRGVTWLLQRFPSLADRL